MDGVQVLEPFSYSDEKGSTFKIRYSGDIKKPLDISEAYFSEVKKGIIKGWKMHSKMQMSLTAAAGSIRLVLFNDDNKEYKDLILNLSNHKVVIVNPGIWVAFKGLEDKNILLNLSDILHDPKESVSRELKEIEFNWS